MGFYNEFAYYYDKLMAEDINYDEICDFIVKKLEESDIIAKNKPIIADLACGTGQFTRRLSNLGYDMIGIDISEDMLNVSRETDEKSLYLNQDISEFELYGTVSGIICMIDGLNYIIDDYKLQHTFDLMYNYLDYNGILIFDMSTLYSLKEIHGNNTFVYEDDNLFYCWENSFDEDENICEMYLNFFVKDGVKYNRFVEEHIQKGRNIHPIGCMLNKSGFINIQIYGNENMEESNEHSERVFFVAQKKGE